MSVMCYYIYLPCNSRLCIVLIWMVWIYIGCLVVAYKDFLFNKHNMTEKILKLSLTVYFFIFLKDAAVVGKNLTLGTIVKSASDSNNIMEESEVGLLFL